MSLFKDIASEQFDVVVRFLTTHRYLCIDIVTLFLFLCVFMYFMYDLCNNN